MSGKNSAGIRKENINKISEKDLETSHLNHSPMIINNNYISLAKKKPSAREILDRYNSLTICRLHGKEIEVYQHKYYLELVKYNWSPFPSPTEFQMIEENGVCRIIDKYDKMGTALYYGAFENGRMVSGLRLNIDKKIDIMNYPHYFIDGYIPDSPFQISRHFVDPEFKFKFRMMVLLLIAIREQFGDVEILGASTLVQGLFEQGGSRMIGFVKYVPEKFYSPIYRLANENYLRKILARQEEYAKL